MSEEPAPLEEWVTHRELADFLGISERALANYAIQRVDLGKQRLYSKSDVALWLANRRGRPAPRLRKKAGSNPVE